VRRRTRDKRHKWRTSKRGGREDSYGHAKEMEANPARRGVAAHHTLFAVSSVAPTTSCPIPATSSTCTCLGARELATDTRLCGINDVERLPIKFGALTAGNVRNDLSWTLVGLSAQAVRDNDLLDTVSACEGDTAGQLKWLKTRMKQAAPQVLVVAEA
jgi:hypothetical protein